MLETLEVALQTAQLVVYLVNGLPQQLAWGFACHLAANCVAMAVVHATFHRYDAKFPWVDEYLNLM